jgi:UDPglucose 6-dehydrogenase
MGLAFKPNTDDIRDAKSLIIIEEILKAGGSVTAHDPIATELVRDIFPTVDYRESIYEVSHEADALVMVTEWNEYRHLDLQRLAKAMKTPILFDGRRCYKKDVAEAAGFEFHTIGSR